MKEHHPHHSREQELQVAVPKSATPGQNMAVPMPKQEEVRAKEAARYEHQRQALRRSLCWRKTTTATHAALTIGQHARDSVLGTLTDGTSLTFLKLW